MPAELSPSVATSTPVGRLLRWQEWPTVLLFVACAAVWALALALPVGWGGVSFALLIFALTLHSSLSHEILHGHPFASIAACDALGAIQPGLFVPYFRFKVLHLAHHYDEHLTDPYDDPESNYLDPDVWETFGPVRRVLFRANNTLLGRVVLGPLIGTVFFVIAELRLIVGGDREVLIHWLAHVPGVVLTLWIVSLSAVPVWVYVAACYGAMSVLKIRTFAEHRAHARASARTAIIEDRGILGFLFLYNNFHVVHHMHPRVCWYCLPALYAAQQERFVRRNQGYVFTSYGALIWRYLVRAKDPVAHPFWRRRG